MRNNLSKIDLAELPAWSQWPERIMGIAPWSIPVRTVEKVAREYDGDKYAKCLALFREGKAVSAEDVKRFEFGSDGSESICVARDGTLFKNHIWLTGAAREM